MYSAIQITRKKKLFHKILKRKNRLLFLTQRIALKYFRLRYHFALSRSVGFQVKLISSTPIMHNMRVDKFAFCCPHKGFLNSTLILLCKKKNKSRRKKWHFCYACKKMKITDKTIRILLQSRTSSLWKLWMFFELRLTMFKKMQGYHCVLYTPPPMNISVVVHRIAREILLSTWASSQNVRT